MKSQNKAKILAIEVGQLGNFYNSRYQQIENYGIDLFLLSGKAETTHWHEGKFFIANSMNITDIINLAQELHKIHNFSGVLTMAESSVISTSMVATALGLPSIGIKNALTSRNKIFMRQAHEKYLAPHPKFQLTPSITEAEKFLEKYGYPAILKPTLGAGSQFVYKINSVEELQDLFPKALEGIKTMSHVLNEGLTGVLGPNTLLMEEFLDGKEYLIEAFIWHKQTTIGSIVERITLEGNNFDDDVHRSPTGLSEDEIKAVHQAIHEGAMAQGLNNSVMHAEIRFHNGKPYILEIAGRPGGGGLDFMARLVYSYCPIKTLIEISTGNKPTFEAIKLTGIHTFALCLICEPGQITKIEIPKEISEDSNVFMLKLVNSVGSIIKRPPFGNDIVGFLGLSGENKEIIEKKVKDYTSKIIVTTNK